MGDLCDHATDGWSVFAFDDLVEMSEAEALDDELVLDRCADLGTEVLQLDFGGCAGGTSSGRGGDLSNCSGQSSAPTALLLKRRGRLGRGADSISGDDHLDAPVLLTPFR